MKKQDLNTSYGTYGIISGDNASLAIKIAERAIQQTIDAFELEGRLQGLSEPDVIEMACNIVDGFFLNCEDSDNEEWAKRVERELSERENCFEKWLTDGKQGGALGLLRNMKA